MTESDSKQNTDRELWRDDNGDYVFVTKAGAIGINCGREVAVAPLRAWSNAIRQTSGKPLVYLACPYSHPDRAVRVARFEAANRAAGLLMSRGMLVFSPISHTHPIAECCDLPLGWEFWHAYDRVFIEHANAIYVLCIDGWMESVGVQAELEIARELGLAVHHVAVHHVDDEGRSVRSGAIQH